VILAITWGTWRMAKAKWWKGCLTALLGWFFVFVVAALTIPTERVGVIMLVTWAPIVAFAAAMWSQRKPGAGPIIPIARRGPLPREVMVGQPNPRSVLKSKVMESRIAAGMPRDAAFLARVTQIAGGDAAEARPADLFVGGGSLWVAPLKGQAEPTAIPLRDVLRVDVWPEGDAPPTLRVSWSPPAGDLTRELVLAAIPQVPPALVGRHLGAVAGAVTDAMQHDERHVIAAGATPELTALPPATCARCGAPLAEGVTRCARCGTPR
jgi:hypothetical protein